MKRGFEVVTKYKDKGINLPYRSTKQAAGYDIEAGVDFVLPSIWKLGFLKVLWAIKHEKDVSEDEMQRAKDILRPLLVPTGIKAYMQPDEMLVIANRSSGPLKRGMVLPNGIGIVDADYYGNESNEGELFVQMTNFGLLDKKIKKGDRIAQGIFVPFLTTDDDSNKGTKRIGGFGSSGK
ncbi:Deoxyuridine 5'-triphosphate nucleotidohydrolase [Apilactobacillus kunkeei]|uniref:dUTP diphosphatase n=1 Tax=Apilactobacillus kunkeei TaxID=148814 RepID=A0A0P7K939_9LACO|nr:dUTP diphosphatase [Apilactobacillus kunkeei]KPN83361.1 DeoxyUTP pyrophosphatase [Apilactobacillus kunkeei]MCK8620636.1 dUTP diphosphatase [Apilactobacillus kunkeei]MCK8626100.1 dUTP diphosphatase [Apilactobacillus kunkeei]MCK8635287.1 dUTP diphosphatase [Apilactobacillus kunkeei]NBI00199.1 dUTP diphosphatase [Apilactobacillus kunkeei]